MRNYKKYKKYAKKKTFRPWLIFSCVLFALFAVSTGYAVYTDTVAIQGTANAINVQYSINYTLNGGTNPQNAVTTFYRTDDIPLPIPTKPNFQFDGWYQNSSFTGQKVTRTSEIQISNPQNLTVDLYANWVTVYSVTYNNITLDNTEPTTIIANTNYSHTFTNAPSRVTVTMGGNTLTENTDFTYSNGQLIINNVTGNLVITGAAGNNYTIIVDSNNQSAVTFDIQTMSLQDFLDQDFKIINNTGRQIKKISIEFSLMVRKGEGGGNQLITPKLTTPNGTTSLTAVKINANSATPTLFTSQARSTNAKLANGAEATINFDGTITNNIIVDNMVSLKLTFTY